MRKFGCLGLLGVMLVLLQLVCPISSQLAGESDIKCLQTIQNQLKDPQGSLYTWNFQNTCWHNDDNRVLSISLQEMGLQGAFPSGVRYCASMTSLTLSQNSLTGTIPYVVTIDLSQNDFRGSIPPELSNCTYLNVLHLNGNQLTGEIPWQLSRMDRLVYFNVSNNKLTGYIPSLRHNISASSFQNNAGLCGPPLSSTCGRVASANVNPMVVAAFLLIGIVLIVWILLGLGWMISKAKTRRSVKIPLPTSKEPNDWQKYVRARRAVKVSLFKKPMRQMTLADLVDATENFSEDNIILCRRTGTLYKAKLPDGSLLAVKRLRPCSVQAEKDFKCEMKALAHLRHRNLVPLLGHCIVDEERFLVYKFLARGTVLNCLHGLQGEHNTLDWAKRLKICIGTARGLAWLHHSCNPHVVHRNISSGIIFLDEEYEPRISGFGLARLMDAEDSNCVTISCSGEEADVELVEDFGYDDDCLMFLTIKIFLRNDMN